MVFLDQTKTTFFLFPERYTKLKEMVQTVLKEHKHVIIRAYVKNPPKEELDLKEWCSRIIMLVGMRVIGGPLAVYSEMEGNRGITAVAILDFSHLAIHVWDEVDPALVEFDLFSCKDFDPEVVLKELDKFELVSYTMKIQSRQYMDQEKKEYVRNEHR